MRSTVTALQHLSSEKIEASINQGESSVRGFVKTPPRTVGVDGGVGVGNHQWGRDNYGGVGSGGGPGNWKYRKLDMPLVDGTDPDGWVLRVDRYFNFYRLLEDEPLGGSCSCVRR